MLSSYGQIANRSFRCESRGNVVGVCLLPESRLLVPQPNRICYGRYSITVQTSWGLNKECSRRASTFDSTGLRLGYQEVATAERALIYK